MSSTVRVAVEGCGHGTLHSIYASVEESCRVKGWDSVDLLIIGGDFQAVRNTHDLNAASMPPKFKQIGDFHEYYSGAKTAPYLTVFIGGNHEASNHLFELYYGGWAAPNIYYIGAANILRLGPLRLAGLSGIWKGYDYRKPHFERLPYNRDEVNSIYHVRELDVRKLLSVRTQVDAGISHDWPQGVEWLGDHQELFRRKDLFEADANEGKLGSGAARQCLARLRPPHWFSAHLHIKYPAVVRHPHYENMPIPGRQNNAAPVVKRPETENKLIPPRQNNKTTVVRRPEQENTSLSPRQDDRAPIVRAEDREQVSAWGQFHTHAQKIDAEDNERALKEHQSLKEQEEKTGIRQQPNYIFNETFKKVKTDDNLGRAVTSVVQEERSIDEAVKVSQLDGCIDSKPGSLKRRRQASNLDEISADDGNHEQPTHTNGVDQNAAVMRADTAASSTAVAVSSTGNPDTIELDMSSDEDSHKAPVTTNSHVPPHMSGSESSKEALITSAAKNPDAIEVELSDEEELVHRHNTVNQIPRSAAIFIPAPEKQDAPVLHGQHSDYTAFSSDPEEDGGVHLNPAASSFTPMASMASILQNEPQASQSRTTSHHSMENLDLSKAPPEVNGHEISDENIISDDMRARLAALNPSFANHGPVEKSLTLPFPEDIWNTTTQFLALDKCDRNRQFLQLLEIDVVSQEHGDSQNRPYKLQYDPEWLAILRVFASELQVGGESTDRVPQHRGETYYRQRIIEEEDYIRKHVVEAGLTDVPNNFSITAPVYDPALQVDARDMPREFTSPQTAAFCSMIGIENHFDITEEERDARIARGGRPEQGWFGGGRGRGGGGKFNQRGRGGRGGNRGGRGGRGRGR